MKNYLGFRLTVSLGALGAGLMLAGEANAVANCPEGNFGWRGPANAVTFTGGCVDGDKYWQGEGTTFPDAWKDLTDNVDVQNIELNRKHDLHIVEFKEFENRDAQQNPIVGPGIYFLDGSISVIDARRWIVSVDLAGTGAGTPANPFDATFWKYVWDNPDRAGDPLLTLMSEDGLYTNAKIPRRQALWFTDKIDYRGGILLTFQNSFEQVPEPTSLALLGLGLFGLGFGTRRRS